MNWPNVLLGPGPKADVSPERSNDNRSGWPQRDEWPGLLAAIVGINAIGASPVLVAGPDSPWFRALEKPALYPPEWAFGVVWTLLFTLLGVALYMIYRRGTGQRPVQVALGAFAVQMALNVAWTPAFFGLESLELGLLIIVLLWIAILGATLATARVDRHAAALFVPYLAWVIFAAVLNYQLWRLNA